MGKNIALIFAGGKGSRMGNEIPKQFFEVNGKAVIIHTLEVFENQDFINGIVVVCLKPWIPYLFDLIKDAGLQKVISVVPGGKTALESQYLGLQEIRDRLGEEDVTVFIHDGVRPMVDGETLQKCLDTVNQYGDAITVSKARETVITIDERECIADILNRDCCYVAKAPQCFRLCDILKVHEQAIRDGRHNFIDSASMMKAYGYKLHVIMGEPENIKITTQSDFDTFSGMLQSKKEDR